MMARRDRPISRWISCVLPEGLPLVTSRGVRLTVARGSMAYSAVIQPFPDPRMNGGTVSSTDAAHNISVWPTLISAEPSAVLRYPVSISTGRIWSGRRLSVRIFEHEEHHQKDQRHHGKHHYQAGNTALQGWRLGFFASRGLEFCHRKSARGRIHAGSHGHRDNAGATTDVSRECRRPELDQDKTRGRTRHTIGSTFPTMTR